jgi:hypothetical protein
MLLLGSTVCAGYGTPRESHAMDGEGMQPGNGGGWGLAPFA